MDLQLKNKKVFISGSTSGIGFITARTFLAEGAHVIINGRKQEDVNAKAELLKKDGNPNVTGIAADFSKPEEIEKLIQQLDDVDILINNVGIFEPKDFAEITDEDWFRFFEINVMSGVRLSKALFPQMLKKDWGRIIFISSESGVFIPQEMIHYGMTKTAQLAVSRGLAELTAGTGVTVNTIMPGPTRSEGVEKFLKDLAVQNNSTPEQVEQDFFKTARPTSLLQRFADMQEVANTIVYYASPLASATNGAAIRVEGGLIRSAV